MTSVNGNPIQAIQNVNSNELSDNETRPLTKNNFNTGPMTSINNGFIGLKSPNSNEVYKLN